MKVQWLVAGYSWAKLSVQLTVIPMITTCSLGMQKTSMQELNQIFCASPEFVRSFRRTFIHQFSKFPNFKVVFNQKVSLPWLIHQKLWINSGKHGEMSTSDSLERREQQHDNNLSIDWHSYFCSEKNVFQWKLQRRETRSWREWKDLCVLEKRK